MDAFLLHLLLLIWTSLGTAHLLWIGWPERILVAALLMWANLVATILLLSAADRLGNSWLFLSVSAALGLLCCLGAKHVSQSDSAGLTNQSPAPSTWLQFAFALFVVPCASASILTAYFYLPNNPDALNYILPGALLYWSQGHLGVFTTYDTQVLLPFNYSLGQLIGLVYAPPLYVLNFINLIAWGCAGIGIYRLSHLFGASTNFSLIACGLTLLSPAVLAQAATTTPELSAAAALICGSVFAMYWQREGMKRNAWLAGLAWGLAAGSDLGTAFFLGSIALGWFVWSWRQSPSATLGTIRILKGPALLGLSLALPFAFISASGNAVISSELQREWRAWSSWLPGNNTWANLHEDLASYGLVGFGVLLGTILCAARLSLPNKLISWIARCSLAWIGTILWLHHDQPLVPRDFLPVFLIASPCLALRLSLFWAQRPTASTLGLVLLVFMVGWDAGAYLLNNGRRPLAPWFQGTNLPNALPRLPVELMMAQSTWIHFESASGIEPLFLMRSRPHQRLTTGSTHPPEALTLLSRFPSSRSAGLHDLTTFPCTRLLPYPGKPTAGVQFIPSMGLDPEARDYYVLQALAGQTTSIPDNQFLLITLSRAALSARTSNQINIQVVGLNPADRARLSVTAKTDALSAVALADFTEDGIVTVRLPASTKAVICRLESLSPKADLAMTEILDRAATVPTTAVSPSARLFNADLVLIDSPRILVSDGLEPSEGPMPQLNPPFVRWARKPSFNLHIPELPRLSRLRLTFNLCSPRRPAAAMEIKLNGVAIRQYRLDPAELWLEGTLELSLHTGPNILEFSDIPLTHEPDWLAYLERYPDVRDYLFANNIPLEKGAQEHYDTSGRSEGRELRYHALPAPPDSRYFVFRSLRVEGFRSP